MSHWIVHISRSAEKDMNRLPDFVVAKAERSFVELSIDPFRPRPGASILKRKGGANLYRARIGDYRILYIVDGTSIYVTAVKHRSVAYD